LAEQIISRGRRGLRAIARRPKKRISRNSGEKQRKVTAEKQNTTQFPNQCEIKNQIKCKWRVKVFNSSVEKGVEKNALEIKSPVLRAPCAHCTIVVQSAREKKYILWMWRKQFDFFSLQAGNFSTSGSGAPV
jgi:hypothetical protein